MPDVIGPLRKLVKDLDKAPPYIFEKLQGVIECASRLSNIDEKQRWDLKQLASEVEQEITQRKIRIND